MDRDTAERVNALMYKINGEIDDFVIMIMGMGRARRRWLAIAWPQGS